MRRQDLARINALVALSWVCSCACTTLGCSTGSVLADSDSVTQTDDSRARGAGVHNPRTWTNCAPTSADRVGCPCSPGDPDRSCYVGPLAFRAIGACVTGWQTCQPHPDSGEIAGSWGECLGSVLPTPEECGSGIDSDC